MYYNYKEYKEKVCLFSMIKNITIFYKVNKKNYNHSFIFFNLLCKQLSLYIYYSTLKRTWCDKWLELKSSSHLVFQLYHHEDGKDHRQHWNTVSTWWKHPRHEFLNNHAKSPVHDSQLWVTFVPMSQYP